MMIDEEPDAPLHVKCAVEIAEQTDQIATLRADLAASECEADRLRAECLTAHETHGALTGRIEEMERTLARYDVRIDRARSEGPMAMADLIATCPECHGPHKVERKEPQR